MNPCSFTPDGQQARSIDLKMRQLLGDSIRHIAQQADGVLTFDRPRLHCLAEGLSRGEAFPPTTFALYAELVMAIQAGDHAEAANRIQQLLNERALPERRQILAFGADDNPIRDCLHQRFMDSDPEARFGIVRPADDTVAAFSERLEAAFLLMSRALPELSAEFDHLVTQIILVAPEPHADYQFDGGSAYMLWGGLFLNALSHESVIALIEVLAHESAHMLLFGFSSDEPLVLNPDNELYPSPLRQDPRPMDGIYHSTYVSARMHWAMSRLLESGLLDPEQVTFARSACKRDQENFSSGYSVVQRHATLTGTGNAVMQSAKDYMDSSSHSYG